MRVLHMIPDIGIANGVMSVILNYFKAMPDDIKFDVCYFAKKEETRQADIEKLGGRVFEIPTPSPKSLLRRDMSAFFAQHKGEWQALHIHAPHFAVFMAPQAKAAGIKKICCHCHSTCFSLKGNQIRNKILSLYSKYFIRTKFACSQEAGRLWYGNTDFTVLNNAIDCSEYAFNEEKRNAVRQKMGLNDSFVVGHIGKTDVTQKNHPFLIKVFSEIKKIKQNAVLLLIGAEETTELEELCCELDVKDSVMFLGARNDVPLLLQALDVFLFPSTNEGLPVSLVEAQAAGLPVIMSDSITNEVCVTDGVFKMSLSAPLSEWAGKLIEISNRSRKNNLEKLISAGWDINSCAEKLKGFYNGEKDGA